MDLDARIDRIRTDLVEAAEIGGTEAVDLAGRLARPLESLLRVTMIELLGAAADAISAELAPGRVTVVIRDGEPHFEVDVDVDVEADTGETRVDPAEEWAATASDDAGEIARISLRLPAGLKRGVDEAADRDSVSSNTWITRAVMAALHPQSPQHHRSTRSARRITGWVQ